MKKEIRSKLKSIERRASELSSKSRESKEKHKILFLLEELNDIWSEIYIPLIKSCEIYKNLEKLDRELKLYSSFPSRILLVPIIIDCLLVFHPFEKIYECIIKPRVYEDFTLLTFALRWHSDFKKIVGDRSFDELAACYKSLASFQVIFFSQYHFIKSALTELNKKIICFREDRAGLWSIVSRINLNLVVEDLGDDISLGDELQYSSKESLIEHLKQYSHNNRQLGSDLKSAQFQVLEMKNDVGQAADRIQNLEASNQQLGSDLKSAQLQIKKMENDAKLAAYRAQRLKEELNEAQKKLTSNQQLESDLKSAQSQVKKMKNEVGQAAYRIRHLEEALKEAKKNLASTHQRDPKGYFARLALPSDISDKDFDTVLKANYRTLSLRYHPDKGGNPELFKKLTEAYEYLSDPSNRAQYCQSTYSSFAFPSR